MDILRKLRRLESRLAKTVDTASQKITQASSREPLEILHAIVEAVDTRIEPAGRGVYVFPFNRITISIAADSRETRARFQAVLESEPPLQKRIVERLHAAGCALTGLVVNTTYVDHSEPQWLTSDFSVEFDRATDVPQPETPSNTTNHSLKLTIVQGTTEQPAYVFTAPRINLGRGPEVRDSRKHLIRANHVAFAECAEEPNLSVSRHHAHIDCTASPAEYRLCDDRSAHGTSVLRSGKTIPVPAGSRGVRLQSGDEISLGDARLHVEIETV